LFILAFGRAFAPLGAPVFGCVIGPRAFISIKLSPLMGLKSQKNPHTISRDTFGLPLEKCREIREPHEHPKGQE